MCPDGQGVHPPGFLCWRPVSWARASRGVGEWVDDCRCCPAAITGGHSIHGECVGLRGREKICRHQDLEVIHGQFHQPIASRTGLPK